MGKLGKLKLNRVYTGDMRELSLLIPDDSIDLIFTDPPYTHDCIYLYAELSNVARRVLKPGGLCIAYSGKTALPQIMDNLATSLDYYWLIDAYEPGASVSLWKWKIFGNHRPILAYSKGEHTHERWFHDAIATKKFPDMKKWHRWGQSEQQADYYIYCLTKLGDIILDPFLGGGTTAVVCNKLDRDWLGFEIDRHQAKLARDRIKEGFQPALFNLEEGIDDGI